MEKKIRKKNEYKSAVRSRQRIREACISLMTEKTMHKITVSDIVRRARINRGTFYAHFSTPENVYAQIAEEFVEHIFTYLGEFEFVSFSLDPLPLLRKISNFLESNMDTYRNLVMLKESENFLARFQNMLISYVIETDTIPETLKKQEDFLTALTFFAGGAVSVYADWVKGTLKTPIEQIQQTMADIIARSARELLNRTP